MNAKKILITSLPLFAVPIVLSAYSGRFVGTRSLGMGGTGVATASDYTAQYHNPAAFGFFSSTAEVEDMESMNDSEGVDQLESADTLDSDVAVFESDNQELWDKDFGMGVDGTVGYTLTGELQDFLNDLPDLADSLDVIDSDNLTSNDVVDLLDALSIIDQVDEPGNAFYIEGNAGFGMRIGHFGIGVRSFFTAFVQVENIDYTNIGLDMTSSNEVVEELSQLADSFSVSPTGTATGNVTSGFDLQYDSNVYSNISESQFDQILGVVNSSLSSGASGIITADDVEQAMIQLDSEVGTALQEDRITDEEIDNSINALVNVVDDISDTTGNGDTAENKTAVLVQGFGYVEIPVTYGIQVGENLSLGVNVKYMQGRVYADSISVFDDNADEVLNRMKNNYQQTETFGIDLAAMYRVNNFQFGINGTNLNSPEFDGFVYHSDLLDEDNIVDSVTVDPQVTIGVAWVPHKTFMLEANLELLETDAVGTSDYNSQYLYLGGEWDIFEILALRGGYYTNLSESEIGDVLTAGVGIELWLARLDIAGAYSLDTVEVDGNDVPKEVKINVSLAMDF